MLVSHDVEVDRSSIETTIQIVDNGPKDVRVALWSSKDVAHIDKHVTHYALASVVVWNANKDGISKQHVVGNDGQSRHSNSPTTCNACIAPVIERVSFTRFARSPR